MNLLEVLRGLWRRWYIVVPGLIIAVTLAVTMWFVIKPGYQRTASQLLLPGSTSVPQGENVFLYIDGLSQVADVVVRTVGAETDLGQILDGHPGASAVVGRDVATAGPVILITVTATSDDEAAELLSTLVGRTVSTLSRLQADEGIPKRSQITAITLTQDQRSVIEQKTRMTIAAGVGIGMVALTILIASVVDGFARRPNRGRGRHGSGSNERLFDLDGLEPESDAPPGADETEGLAREAEAVVSEREGGPPDDASSNRRRGNTTSALISG
ncbi:hypothetical protein [Microbacterium deminutum]|uniref:Capsular polysaccharide biosynthesis protein n=1 Tax=Microbacterium deminutum TaxID=344164 RepID=A0ABN2QL41_9MICO